MSASRPKLLVLDSSFAYEAIRARGLEESVTCRDLGGFFEHVWTVHPFATLVTTAVGPRKYGTPETHALTPAHTFIDGKMGRFSWLRRVPGLNFLIGQASIFAGLVTLVRRNRINVIRAGDPLYLGIFGWLLARVCAIPLVVRVGANHDKMFLTTGQPIMRRLFRTRRIEKAVERFVLSRADLVAAANKDNLEFALANGAKAHSSTLFRYGNLISKSHFTEPRLRGEGRNLLAEIGVEPGGFLLYIGRLERVKHPDDVIRVLAELRRRGHDLKAVLAGDGRLQSELAGLAVELGVADFLVFAGNRGQDWLSRVIPLAKVVVSPHTGRALAEAALGAASVVAYDIDWQSELVESGVTGELVAHLDLEGMTAAAERLLLTPAYAAAMGNAIRARALEMLNAEKLDCHERDQYSNLLNRAQS